MGTDITHTVTIEVDITIIKQQGFQSLHRHCLNYLLSMF